MHPAEWSAGITQKFASSEYHTHVWVCSAAIFMLEVQRKWWLPAPLKLGWQVGLWNFIGAWGFEASGRYHSSAPALDKGGMLLAIRVSTRFSTERSH